LSHRNPKQFTTLKVHARAKVLHSFTVLFECGQQDEYKQYQKSNISHFLQKVSALRSNNYAKLGYQ